MMNSACAKKILVLIFFVSALASLNFAQQPLKMGIVNSQEVLEKSIEGKKVIVQLQDRDKKNQATLAKMDDDIHALESKINTQRITLTDEAFLQINSDLEKKRKDRQRFGEDSLRDIQELRDRLFLKIQNELIAIIEQLGKEKNLDLILDLAKSGAIYWSPTISLTDEVVRRYDASKATATPPTK
jgi:Skp family chaperone for outer membrane proteins